MGGFLGALGAIGQGIGKGVGAVGKGFRKGVKGGAKQATAAPVAEGGSPDVDTSAQGGGGQSQKKKQTKQKQQQPAPQKQELNLSPQFSGRGQAPTAPVPGVQSFKKGGKVRRTGLAYLHKGETVISAGGKRASSRGKLSVSHKKSVIKP